MKIELGTIRQSPFVGIFAIATTKREMSTVRQLFDAEVMQATVANSNLLGALAIANSRGIVLPKIAEQYEVNALQRNGIRVKVIEEISALGNLIAVNDSKGICAKHAFSEKQRKEIARFLSIELMPATIAESDLVGASCLATDNPHAQEKETNAIKKHFGLPTAFATANHGDAFIANSVIANSQAALAGAHTTTHELMRIEEGLSGT
jgi:translation initiation factor 6